MLRPQHIAAGDTARTPRTMSRPNSTDGDAAADGLIGQYGNTPAISHAAQPTPAAAPSCDQASTMRGRTPRSTSAAPATLPAPSATRYTARMIENAYTV